MLLFLNLIAISAFAVDPGVIFNVNAHDLCSAGVRQLCSAPTVRVEVCPFSYTNPPYTAICGSPTSLFTDPTLVTPTTNPVPVDKVGRANIFTNAGEYILQFLSPTNKILYQQPVSSNASLFATIPLNNLTAATTSETLTNSNFGQTWNWSLTSPVNALKLGEAVADANPGTILKVSTLSGSNSFPIQFTANGAGVLLDTTGLLQVTGGGSIKATTTTLAINTTSPLGGGGNLTGNLTLTCATCVSTNNSNRYTAGPQDWNTDAVTMEVANDTVTGTVQNQLAKVTSTGAILIGTSDTNVPVYVVDSGAGKSGNSFLAVEGIESCIFDASTSGAAGLYVVPSPSVGGDCTYAFSPPSAGFEIGVLLDNTVVAGSPARIIVFNNFVNTLGGGVGTVNTGNLALAGYTASGTAISPQKFTFTSNTSGALTLGTPGPAGVQGSLVISGSTSGTTTLAAPAAGSGTMTLQAGTDVIVARATTDTLTGKNANAESTGNTISIPARVVFRAAECINATAGYMLDAGTTNDPTPACQGTNSRKGVLQFARGNAAYITYRLPQDWNSGVNIDLGLEFTTTDTTNGHVTAWNIQTGCNKVDGTATDDPALNTLQSLSFTNGASAVSGGAIFASLSALTTTGCATGNNLVIAITRNNSGTDTNTDTAVGLKYAQLTFGRSENSANR